jgi:transcriptional regulator with XRE-family HTH domain/mannose-6-phosphate isomerase-like protein (cupin superfamily)
VEGSPSRSGQPGYSAMGDHLRAARRRRHLSLRDLAARIGLSPSLISQVETGRARPSVSTLYAIANELDVSLDELLFNDAERGGRNGEPPLKVMPAGSPASTPRSATAAPVQRGDDRKVIRLASGVVWERLTTDSVPGIDFLYVTYEVGGASSPENEFQRHGGHEWGFVMSGRLGVTIGFEEHELGPGDSISIDSTVPHRLYNRGTVPVHGIWFALGRRSLDVPGLGDE